MTYTDNFSYMSLPNGLRMVHRRADTAAEYCGVAVKAGSRNETADTYGLAHFVEHTIFKGTSRRRSWHIINRMESVGGDLNAFTTEETTVVYSTFPSGHLDRAAELIADLIVDSVFPSRQIDREREVVLDEIDSYLDTPSESVFDDFNELLFAGSSLGHNILGTPQTIKTFGPEICRSFLERWYTPLNAVFFYQGPREPEAVERIVARRFGEFRRPFTPLSEPEPAVAARFDITREKGCHQAHTIVGARTPGLFSEHTQALSLLNNIIGGPGMNSLLNMALRERHGYVYAADSGLSFFSDCGSFTIYFGCGSENVKPCRRLVAEILDRLAGETMSVRALDAAKKQYAGQLAVASDNKEQMALEAARSMLYRGYASTTDSIAERVMSITPDQLRQAAELLASSRCSVLTYL